MFKDYDKYLSTSLKVYLFVLVIIFIMKIVGLDYFGLDLTNPTITRINEFCIKYHLINVYYSLTLYIYTLFLIAITFNKNDKDIKIKALIFTIIGIALKFIEGKYPIPIIVFVLDFLYMLLVFALINIKEKRKFFIKYLKVFLLSVFYQLITLFLRNINYANMNNFIVNSLLDLDYILLLIITYKVYFMKGVNIKCIMEVGSSSLKKISLSNLLKRLQRNYHNFKKLDKETKLTYAIYFILSLIWNTTTLVIILAIASLNDTLIECLFILTSFWLSKRTFGKAFHLPSMIQCFIVSNLTYYALNRITTPIGISIIVPILLGVGLSYVTSKLVKKMYKPLYRGMPEGVFEETITKVVEKDSYKYKICYDYFIKKESALKLSYKYNYSEAGIRKIKDRVNIAIKELNK